MKRIVTLFLSFVLLLSCLCAPASALFDPSLFYEVQARSAYVVNTDTNIIVYDKDSSRQVPAGGLTKYMTIALLLTNYADQLDNTFQMPFAISDYVHNSDNADMRSNETFTYREAGSFRDESDSVLLKLVQEDNGETYLYQKSYASIPGLTTLCVASYAMERLPSSQPDEATQAAWEAREGKMYVQTNERWSSAYYALSGVFAAVTLQGSPEGYLLTNQLTAPDTAAPVLQIPGTGSRDSAVIRVLDVDGCETLELNGSLYQDASSVSPIFSGPESWCIIRPGQTARWYRTGEAAGSQMTVEVPENGGFYVYDAALGLQASSWLYGDTTVVLPENGWIVFSGEEGAQFHIYLSQP